MKRIEPRNNRSGAVATLLAAAVAIPPSVGSDEAIDFQRDVRPILADRCYPCHGPDEAARKAGLRLDTAAGATATRDAGVAVVPSDPDRSLLLARITADDELDRMPPPSTGPRLEPAEIERLRRWIEQGAEYTRHWSLIPVRPVEPPAVADARWPRSPIDHFVLARLEAEGVGPASEADRRTLIRRVTLDLTGLPPTPEDVEAYLGDDRPDAYERVVDRLLADPHYGERWGAVWLDLARYADTKGYEADRRRTIWPYRDWVIRAFNDDMPFDRFTIEQLAGDLLEGSADDGPSIDQLVATAFHRNTMTNDEGGTDDEEFRVAAVVDRVNTTMQTWMGLTVACAQCHDHKFDPIGQDEYFRLFAFFNNTADADRMDEQPLLPVPTPKQRSRLAALESQREELTTRREAAVAAALASMPAWESALRDADAIDVRAGLVVHVPLDEDATDVAEPARPTAIEGEGVTIRPGVLDAAIELGAGQWVDLGDAADFDRDEPFSYGGWILPATDATTVPIARLDAANGFRGWDLFLHERRAYVHVIHRWPDDVIRVNTRRRLKTGTWHHVMVTYDGSSRAAGIRIYIDGEEAELDRTHDSLTGTIRTSAPLLLGRRKDERHFEGRLDDMRVYDRALGADEVDVLVTSGLREMASSTPRDPAHVATLRRIHLTRDDDASRLDRSIDELDATIGELRVDVPSIPIMRELPADQRRETHVLGGGSFLNPTERVTPGVPEVLHELPSDASLDRLELARWIVAPENPLTARVAVNRVWEQLFGRGLVETTDDFGTQGSLPSHPLLLDWLADRLVRDGWSLKSLCRRIVTSATYRQSSTRRPELETLDPDNLLLGRGPRFRLPAETIRDQALAVSGLLDRTMYGPPVFPPQPDGIWQIVYSDDRWQVSDGGDRYRRALYTFWRRTSPHPAMTSFDAPSREVCVSKRIRTNTPLQALVTLNDPAFVEAAQGLARRVLREAGPTPKDRIDHAMRLTLARPATAEETTRLRTLLERLRTRYAASPDDARRLASDPLGPLPGSIDPVEAAAWTVVANVLLNLDELLVKG